ncbi:MAG: tRNA (N(6)-L-threonylcarbamoyladenosine(37)-C(2))-methylthiotransferase MtaB [Marinilabiliaceae bacterium]|nr:tRNA (N(6)-L-threonylcarbamoyladenosine(37)-C(2))-methylthiotransferase MtaB [Marinilabiliaceae bacterium]
MKVAFKTLGCRLNQYETDSLAAQFQNNGYVVSESELDADIIVVNTCTVTNQSNHKSRNVISHAHKVNPDAKLFITGCMTVSHKDQICEKFPSAYIIDNEHKSAIFHAVDSVVKTGEMNVDSESYDLFSYQSSFDMFHTRSLIKIQDGCDNFCTYCIIPMVRGRAISRPIVDIIENIKYVLSKGAKEIVLTGVNISRYYYEGVNFSGLLEQILNIDGNFRVRISSIEPDRFDSRFSELVKHPKLAPHLHICLQSGSDNILLQMKRMYSVRDFINIVESVRKQNPLFNFTTDVIVGFPGETDEDFGNTVSISKEIGFGHMHIFKYSVRQNTRAQRMSNHVSDTIKTVRSKQLHDIAEELKKNYFSSLIGVPQQLLVEKVNDCFATGYSEYFVPLVLNSNDNKRNSFVNVKGLKLLVDDDLKLLVE